MSKRRSEKSVFDESIPKVIHQKQISLTAAKAQEKLQSIGINDKTYKFGRISGRKYKQCGIVAAQMNGRTLAPLQYDGTITRFISIAV